MANAQRGPVVDADGHVLEPADTWLKYIDPQYRDRAIRIAYDDPGYENLLLDNKPLELIRGHIPRNVIHQIVNTGAEEMFLVAALGQAPVRVYTADNQHMPLPWQAS
ncbi:MAG: hypothetical protein HYZ72_20915 [Deltaproteobacteria bacterium]|nr:hypothetical protein [Deltaproteobacteria bacterium]